MTNAKVLRRLVSLALTIGALSLSLACPRTPDMVIQPPPHPVQAEPEATELGSGKATSRSSKRVDLTYMGEDDMCAADHSGDVCVQTRPQTVTIWKDTGNGGKPKKVRWWIDDAQSGEYYFEIVYKGADPAENWLGTVDPIDCNDNHTTSIKPDAGDLPAGPLDWPYRVTVWSCLNGEKNPDGCLCKTDPRVEILD